MRGGRNNVDRVLAAFGAHRPTRRQLAGAFVLPKKIKFIGFCAFCCGRRQDLVATNTVI